MTSNNSVHKDFHILNLTAALIFLFGLTFIFLDVML